MFFLNSVFGFNNPKLPQNDWLNQSLRKAQLEIAKKSYQWTTDAPNLQGVPLLKTQIPLVVPYASRPTLIWVFEVTEVVLKIALNLVEVLTDKVGEDAEKAIKELLDHIEHIQKMHTATKVLLGKQGNEDFSEKLTETLKRSSGLVRESLDGVSELVSGATQSIKHFAEDTLGIETEDAPKSAEQKALNDHGKGLIAHFSKLNQSIINLQARIPQDALADVADFYNDLFKAIPLPEVAKNYASEASFSQYRTQGPNPMLIAVVAKLNANYGITDKGYKSIMGEDDSLAAAIQEKRLFVCDYAELEKLTENDSQLFQSRFVPSPIAFFARAKAAKSLTPVAIQTYQNQSDGDIVYAREAGTRDYWKWMQARTMVQNADGNYHELFVHLARTHLVIEAVAVATHRNLSRRHPLWVLLMPHMEGTLFINEAAAASLISADGPINMVFGGDIHTTQEVAGADRLNYDFYANMLKSDLKRRGVDSTTVLPDYPYRDDALLIWDAIESWAKDYVDVYYQSDRDVSDDKELLAWTDDIITNGQVAGFKVIACKAQLVQVLTMIIFTASAQHAAVNFPQRTLMSYPPALSAAVTGEQPFKLKAGQQAWENTLPPFIPSIVQVSTLVLLGSVYYRKLGEYRSNTFPYLPWFGHNEITKKGGPLDRFKQTLEDIEKHIESINITRDTPYPYLLPSQIPPSINI